MPLSELFAFEMRIGFSLILCHTPMHFRTLSAVHIVWSGEIRFGRESAIWARRGVYYYPPVAPAHVVAGAAVSHIAMWETCDGQSVKSLSSQEKESRTPFSEGLVSLSPIAGGLEIEHLSKC